MKTTLIFITLYIFSTYVMIYGENDIIIVSSVIFLLLLIITFVILKVKEFKLISKLEINDFIKNELITLYLLIIFFGLLILMKLSVPESLSAIPGLYFLFGLPVHLFAIYDKVH